MTAQSRKTYCYLFTINRIEDARHLRSIFNFFNPITSYLVLGVEPKEKIGSNHIQGFCVLNTNIKFYQVQKNIKYFLKKLENNPSIYFTKVKDPKDISHCTKYCIKKKKAILKIAKNILIINNNSQKHYCLR
jgi:hypothetical protein